jgi:hypothetical protein
MVSAGRFFWLPPLEWAVLIVSVALCGCLALFI